MTATLYATIGAAFALGVFLGVGVALFVAQKWDTKLVEPQQLSQLMDRLVNAEEAEVRANVRRAQLQRAGRRTQRIDGSPPATVHKMRRRKRSNRPAD